MKTARIRIRSFRFKPGFEHLNTGRKRLTIYGVFERHIVVTQLTPLRHHTEWRRRRSSDDPL